MRTVTVSPWKLELWEVGGSPVTRAFWNHYASTDTHGLLWVIDGADASRLDESAHLLRELLRT